MIIKHTYILKHRIKWMSDWYKGCIVDYQKEISVLFVNDTGKDYKMLVKYIVDYIERTDKNAQYVIIDVKTNSSLKNPKFLNEVRLYSLKILIPFN